MRNRTAYLAAGLIWLASSAVAAEPPAAQASTATAPAAGASQVAAAPEDPMICRRESPTGSRIATIKVCRTRSEWNARSKRRGSGGGELNQMDCGAASCEMTPRPSGS
jgi:hypothetical protein